MALFKIARSLVRNPSPLLRPCSALQSLPPPPLADAPNPFSSTPLRRWVPSAGPLFLSLPAWKLSQSATPLYLCGKEVIFPKDLLSGRRIPVELGLESMRRVEERVGNVVEWEKKQTPTPTSASPSSGGEVSELQVEDRFLNLPNMVSIGRMASGPLLGWMIVNEWYLSAFCGLVISGLTDWLDGFLARKMNIHSVYGSYLDPLADKVLIGCVALAMVENGLLHPGLVCLVVLRDVGLVGGVIYRRAASLGWEWKNWLNFVNLDGTHREKVEPLLISKVNTVFQLLLVAAALLQPEFGSESTQLYITYLSWLVASTTVVSAVGYGSQFLKASAAAIGKCRPN